MAREHDEEAPQMTTTPPVTFGVATAVQPTITYSTFPPPPVPPADNAAPEPKHKARLRLVE